jgi:hypothetical protein
MMDSQAYRPPGMTTLRSGERQQQKLVTLSWGRRLSQILPLDP